MRSQPTQIGAPYAVQRTTPCIPRMPLKGHGPTVGSYPKPLEICLDSDSVYEVGRGLIGGSWGLAAAYIWARNPILIINL